MVDCEDIYYSYRNIKVKNSIDVVFDLERQEFERLADALTLEIISLLDNKTLILHNLNCTDSGIISMNYDLE